MVAAKNALSIRFIGAQIIAFFQTILAVNYTLCGQDSVAQITVPD